ncbi:rubrerythrin [Candidatus Epulonipiscium viviparus]|uniref:rubrerythrin n=1 Tax=Candidatus Epulonipiscium viviparus TaxID=420336 RepID=UPI00016C072E|nr:rubrerythrin family protein [Candidatus Epulopiscium viviparus]
MNLKGSKTEENLKTAFAGEAQARSKYHYYASQAAKDGYKQISDLFTETANNEEAHAKIWFKLLHDGAMPDTESNLKDAIKGEKFEWSDMYLGFAEVAKEEGFNDIAKLFQSVGAIEKEHETRYAKLLENLENKSVFKKNEKVEWICTVCGHTLEGLSAPKVCPVCSHPQAFFEIKAYNY